MVSIEGTYWDEDPADIEENSERFIPRLTKDNTHRTDRIKAIGNGQVPSCVLLMTQVLAEALEEEKRKKRA